MRLSVVFVCVLHVLINGPETESSKILVSFSAPSFSHYTLGIVLVEELARRGHDVTFISPFANKVQVPNCRQISTSHILEVVQKHKDKMFDLDKGNPISNFLNFATMTGELTKQTLEAEEVQQLLKSNASFDAVIVEYFMNEAHFGLASHFKAPLIVESPTTSSLSSHLVANPAPSSYVPNVMSPFTKHMNFWQRLGNLLMNSMFELIRALVFLPTQREIFDQHFKTGPRMDDMASNISILLSNSHVSITDAVPLLPSIVEIGGYHVRTPKKLPQDLQKFLDDCKDGVVLFSMGSNLKSANLNVETRNNLLRAFSKIKQKVLWKFEEDLPNLPKNVKIMKWIPQNDILAHPNIQVFISHGGMLSSIESIYHGVPIIGIPVFGDQKNNIANAVNNGYALSIPLQELTEEKLSKALDEILNNPRYRNEARRRSRVMRDQPEKPLDRAMFWIEYVIRHQGAPQLRSAAIDLKWYQRHMIDIILFLTTVTILLFVIFYIVIKKLLNIFFGGKAKAEVSRQKKNK